MSSPGAKSRGPQTPEGKARSAQNALKHGFRAQKYVVLPDEDATAFQALEAALIEELAPEGVLQSVLARRVVAATWRLERAERLEAELFAEEKLPGKSLALALIRDCNGARAFDTLLRYRGGTLAELWRALRTLKALQAEARAYAAAAAEAPASVPAPRAVAPALAAMVRDPAPAPRRSQTNPRAVGILAIQTERTRASQVQRPHGCRPSRCRRQADMTIRTHQKVAMQQHRMRSKLPTPRG
jgi:hypothetical protein